MQQVSSPRIRRLSLKARRSIDMANEIRERDSLIIKFEKYGRSRICKLKEDHQPRVVFVSIFQFWRAWEKLPFDIVFHSIVILHLRKEWVFPTSMDDLSTDITSSEEAKQYRYLCEHLCASKNATKLRSFLTLLRWKERQNLLLWIDPHPSSMTPTTEPSSFPSVTPSSVAQTPLSAQSSMVSKFPFPSAMGEMTPTKSSGLDYSCVTPSTDSITFNQSYSNNGSNSAMTAMEELSIDPKWIQISDFLSKIRDPITHTYYNPIITDEKWWLDKYHMTGLLERYPEFGEGWQDVITQLQYCGDFYAVRNEIQNMRFKYNPFQEILRQSNVTLVPMTAYNEEKWRIKAMVIAQFQKSFLCESMKNSQIDLSLSKDGPLPIDIGTARSTRVNLETIDRDGFVYIDDNDE